MHLARRSVIAVVAVALAGLSLGPSAQADTVSQTSIVSAVPSNATPNVQNGTVLAIAEVGSRIIIGGTFTSATSPKSSTAVPRSNILAFDPTSGVIDPNFATSLDGTVENLTPGPTPDTVYAAGEFNNVNGNPAKGVVLLDTTTGQQVAGFQPAALDGVVYGVRLSTDHTHLFIGGSFTKAGGAQHQGLASLSPTTGKLDSYMNVQLTGHHNYTGLLGQSDGRVGPRKIAVSPDGSRMVAIGNFKNANGVLRDQIVMIDLGPSSASLDTGWATLAYTAACIAKAYDTYMSDVDFSPDGSYFAVGATGGSGTNSDGTNSTCDSVARFETGASGANIRPTWIDYTGQDTIGSVAVAGDAIYAGGHQRWLNNELARDKPLQGAVPRPGLAALDPQNGLPFSWNPGRNPRGIGAYALLVTSSGLYVGSDTNYIGNHKYLRERIAYFPLAGGETPPPNHTTTLPTNVYQAGPGATPTDTLQYRSFDGSNAGTTNAVTTNGIAWSQVRGAFMVDNTLFYGMADGTFNERSYDGSTFGSATSIDPYDDPVWSNVSTGSGQTYRGMKPALYGQMSSVTGMFYSAGMLYYTLSGQSTLYSRYFTPESGIIGAHVFSYAGGNLSSIAGMFYSGGKVYYAAASNGALHSVTLSGGALSGDTVVDAAYDWRARGLFLDNAAPGQNKPPTAVVSASCQQLTCSFDGSTSSDPDGTVKTWAWTFGDGATATGSTVSHTYGKAGTYPVQLTVTDNGGATGTASTSVSPAPAQGATISYVGSSSTNGNAVTETVHVPSGVQAGDGMVLVATSSTASAPAGPTGWTQMKTVTNGGTLTTTVWQRVATATDAGSSVSVGRSGSHKASLQLVAYHGTNGTSPISVTAQTSDTTSSASHTTPTVNGIANGSWVISYWADKASGPNTWSAPNNGPTVRDTSYGSGAGQVSALIADAGPVGAGSYGGLTATTNPAVPRAEQWTIVLTPGA